MIRKFVLIVCGLVAAGFSLPAAYLNASSTFHGTASVLAGAGAVVVVVFGLAVAPVIVQAFKSQNGFLALVLLPAWLLCFAFTLVNSISYTSGNRGDVVVEKAGAIAHHERASADLVRWNADLELAKKSPLWESTSGCAAVTRKTKAFCDHVQELGNNIERADTVVDAVRPATADAQADLLSWVSGLSPQEVGRVLPAWFVLCVEVVAMCSFVAASSEDPTVPAKKSMKRKKRTAPKRPRSGTPALKVVKNG